MRQGSANFDHVELPNHVVKPAYGPLARALREGTGVRETPMLEPAPTGSGHRLFAAFYERVSIAADRKGNAARRARLVGDLRGQILEIGVGNGLNLAHYRAVDRLTALEPDPYMRRRLAPRVAAVAFPVAVLPISAEKLPFPDETLDAVVVSLVLCSVRDPERVLSEIHRVLKPGGELRFLEHVRGAGVLGYLRDAITPLWRRLGAGCHPNRNTEAMIRAAGFDLVEIERYQEGFLPHIQGRGVRS